MDKLDVEWSIEIEPEEINEDTLNSNEVSNAAMTIHDEAPLYESDFTGFLTEKEYHIETGKHVPNDAVPKKVCFNCLGDHNLTECKVRKDHKKISQNRQEFLGKRGGRNVRYHEEEENKFSHLKPGAVSESLREALGLHSQETPEFIYRMRVLGYPPGWLKDAEVNRSAVSLIDGTGNAVIHPDDEEGETDIQVTKYQPEKLISFPGFNVPLPSKYRDEHRYYGCPALQSHHRKEEFEKFMFLNQAQKYKRKKLKCSKSAPPSSANVESSEMDLDDNEDVVPVDIEFNPPLPKESPPPAPPVDESSQSPQNDDNQPSPQPEGDQEDSSGSEKVEDSTLVKGGDSTPMRDFVEDSLTNSPSSCGSPFSTPVSQSNRKRHHRSRSKGCSLGLFIPQSITPHKDLPNSEKWSVDVTDHLLFENLPDALGTWNKMKGLVMKVRKSMDQITLENEDEG